MTTLPCDVPVEIRNRENFVQATNFTGLRWKQKLMPTDVDGVMEFADKLFIFLESKFGETPMPYGQKLALERITDAIGESGRPSFCLLASHVSGKGEDVYLAKSIVTMVRHDKKWEKLKKEMTVKQVMDELLKKYAPEYLD